MKKIYLSLICFLLLISVVLAGCGSSKEEATPTEEPKAEATAEPAEEPEDLRIVKEPLTLTYWGGSENLNGFESFNDVLAYQETEKRTGIHIDFKHPPQDQKKEQLNLMLASKELPDIIETDWKDALPGGLAQAYQEGLIIKLDDYIEKYAPNLSKILKTRPEVAKQMRADDGSIYGIGGIYEDRVCQGIYFGPIVREDWLEKLGLQRPETIDDWYNMMKAFREKDANGNGKQDEIGLISEPWHIGYSGSFASAFGVTNDFCNDNGTVKYGYIQPEYKQFLATMNKWYNEGLLDKDFASQNGEAFYSKVESGIAGAFLGWGGDVRKPVDPSTNKNPELGTRVPVKYPVLNRGDKVDFGQIENEVRYSWAAVTTANKHVIETVKWLDYKFSDEGALLFNAGIEGKTYTMVDGKPQYTDYLTKDPEKDFWSMGQLQGINHNGPNISLRMAAEQTRVTDIAKTESTIYWGDSTFKKIMPAITPTPEEAEKLGTIMTEIQTYVDDMFLRFIMGKRFLDEFDDFTAKVKSMGIDEAIQIKQAALDRYNKR